MVQSPLQLFVKLAGRAGDENSAGNVALTVLHTLHDPGGLATLRTVGALGRIHYLLAITCFSNLRHGRNSSFRAGA